MSQHKKATSRPSLLSYARTYVRTYTDLPFIHRTNISQNGGWAFVLFVFLFLQMALAAPSVHQTLNISIIFVNAILLVKFTKIMSRE